MRDRIGDARLEECWARLSKVTDPELDEPVTELGFVEWVEVRGDEVEVDFRLPTYWCAANFAFLMVDDIRLALEALPWVERVRPRLQDHMYAEEVNRGVAEGLSFDDAFGDLAADEGLDTVRRKFRVKAFQRRQEAVLQGLRREGHDAAALTVMTLGTLQGLSIRDPEGAKQRPRYLESLLAFSFGRDAGDPAFVTVEGARLRPDRFDAYVQELAAVRINMEFNGAICRGLLATRYKEVDLKDGEPTLVDFMLNRVPPRARASAGAGDG
jgi:metal-sulfur cluster biosynthetic enzyme